MTSDSFNDLPGPKPSQIDPERAAESPVSPQDVGGGPDFPDEEIEKLVEDATDELHATASVVTDEDLSTGDLLHNEVSPEDLERDPSGIRRFEADRAEPGQQDTIEDRIRQEEPEPDHDVVPRRATGTDPEAPLSDPEVQA